MTQINKTTIEVIGKRIDFSREISKILEFENVYVVHTKSKEGELINDGFKIFRVFGISKCNGDIIWKRFGFDISKQKKEKNLILLNNTTDLKKKYYLVIYAISMLFYINPDTGDIIRQEQTK